MCPLRSWEGPGCAPADLSCPAGPWLLCTLRAGSSRARNKQTQGQRLGTHSSVILGTLLCSSRPHCPQWLRFNHSDRLARRDARTFIFVL